MTIRFPALLEDGNGQVIAYGSAEIAPEPNGLNFISGFIPLYPIGTELTIVQINDDIPQEKLRGEVYISSRSLLRLTNIEKNKMSHIYDVFGSNTRIKAEPYVTAPAGFLSKLLRRKSEKVLYSIDATVYYVSETQIKLLSIDKISAGDPMIIDLPVASDIEGIHIEIAEEHNFGNIMNAYICDVVTAPQQYYDFVSSLSE